LDFPTPANTRRDILEALKRDGSLSAKDLSGRLKITVAGVRQHLATCLADGLVGSTPLRRGPGRPKLMFTLTDEGQRLFGQRYDRMCLEILENARSVGGEALVEALFDARQKNLIKQYKQVAGQSDWRERVRSVAKIRDDEGYMASVEAKDGDVTLVERHCPISCVASAHPALCELELKLIQKTMGPGVKVERSEHMMQGDHVCRYRVRSVKEGRSK
jgi:predicted ArsR family transcriptional regulator